MPLGFSGILLLVGGKVKVNCVTVFRNSCLQPKEKEKKINPVMAEKMLPEK